MKPGKIIMIVAGAVMLTLGLALDWAKNPDIEDRTGNHPFKYPLGAAAFIIIVLVGVVAALLVLGVLKRDQAPWPTILLGGAAVGAVLMVIQLLVGAGEEDIDELGTTFDLDPYIGMYVALAAAIVSLLGAVLDFTSRDSEPAQPLPPPAV